MKRFKCKIDWSKGLMAKLAEGLKKGMWFQRGGERFFVPAKQIQAYFDSDLGMIEIYFWSENPATVATYSIITYGERWALKEEDLEDIYIKIEIPSEEAIQRNEERLEKAKQVFKD